MKTFVCAFFVSALAGCATPAGVRDAPPPMRSAYANVNGLRMYYEDSGSGPPLVLLHGGGSTAQTSFGAIMPALARTHRVIAPEQQGHGHTADIDRPLSFEQMADDTDALLEQLGIREADVLGFSNGGTVAMQLAIRHPSRVRRLIVCSAIFRHDGLPPVVWKGFEHASPADMPAPLRDAYLAVAPHPDALPTLVTKTVTMLKAFTGIPDETLRALDKPTFVMTGDADAISPEHATQLVRLLPNARLAVFPRSGHGTYLGTAEGAVPGSPLPGLALTMIDAFLGEP